MNAKQWIKDHKKEIILIVGAGAVGALVGVNVTRLRGTEKMLFKIMRKSKPKLMDGEAYDGLSLCSELNAIFSNSKEAYTFVPEQSTSMSGMLERVKEFCGENNLSLDAECGGVVIAFK